MSKPKQTIPRQNGSREVSDVLLKATLTDQGNAECLSRLYGEELRYCASRGCWMHWDGAVWQPNADHEARQMIVETARQRRIAAAKLNTKDKRDIEFAKDLSNWSFISERRNIVKNTLEAAADLPEFHTTIDLYDADINLLGVRNGVVDLTTGEFRESDPEDYLTMQSGVAFDEKSTCSKWEKFLEQIFNGDHELIRYIQKAVGYSLTGDTSEQVLFLLWGKGANGKSVFLYVLKELLGSYAATAGFDTFDANRRGDQTNDLARLKGKRLVTIIESEEDRYLAEAKIKAVTGEDTITCRFLHKEFFEYEPQFKIFLAMNHKPRIRGTDDGIWRRIRLIPFTRQFGEKERDQHLRSKLRAELSGVLNWALEGLAMYRSEGLGGVPEAIRVATDEYRRESDAIGQWIDESVVKKAGVETSPSELYRHYREWMLERGLVPKGLPEFGKELSSRGFESKRKNVGKVYLGIELSSDSDDVPFNRDDRGKVVDINEGKRRAGRSAARSGG